MITEPELDRFFGGLKTRLEGAVEYKLQAARFLGRFNVFRYIGAGELRLSDILANLVDPAGSHGQGDAFLRRLLDLIQNREAGAAIGVTRMFRESLERKRRIRVRREAPTLDGRRIDIMLRDDDAGLGIENKPGGVHQNEQVSHYADELARRFPKGWALIYLSGDGTPPPETSLCPEKREQLRKSGNYVELNYAEDLAEWLDTCVHGCEADKVRWFLRDFHDHVVTSLKNQGVETKDA